MSYFYYWMSVLVLGGLTIYLDRKYNMLRDTSTANIKPYSFSRVQLAWWSVLVLSSIITILLAKDWQIPDLSTSTLYLLGISGTTTATATLIDISDQNNSALSTLSQNQQGENFFLDMLSDNNGVSVHRFQTVVFNLVFGIWFMRSFLININGAATDVNTIIPSFTDNNLILLGVSSGLYAATKAMENKKSTSATTTQTTGQTN